MNQGGSLAELDDGYSAGAHISDPLTCGEDVVANLDHLVALSERHCVSCGGYHAWHGLDRVIRTRTGIDNDRPDLIAILQKMITSLAGNGTGDAIELLIPGSADTGILSTCAHAAWTLGEATASKLRYTVMDRCETPLALCRIYGKHHGLAVRTIRTDFVDPLPLLTADIVVLHSLLSFIPRTRHVGFLRELGSMLTPTGRIVLSNRLDNTQAPIRDPKDFGLLVRAALESGKVKPSVPADRIIKSGGADTVMHFYSSEEELRTVFAGAGLEVESAATVAKLRERPAHAEKQYTVRFIAILHH
jgi:hypothetical protein